MHNTHRLEFCATDPIDGRVPLSCAHKCMKRTVIATHVGAPCRPTWGNRSQVYLYEHGWAWHLHSTAPLSGAP
eukprot:scaffold80322_cov26-Tisochrysis_lutea.AAC.5